MMMSFSLGIPKCSYSIASLPSRNTEDNGHRLLDGLTYKGEERRGLIGPGSLNQAVLGRWGRGRRPGAPPAEAGAGAPGGGSAGLEAGGASGLGLGGAGKGAPVAAAPGGGVNSAWTQNG